MLRNLEAKLGGLVEGAFGRAFKTSVQPVELAHKLAKEMEDNQMASVSRVYVPNHYRVFLSEKDREQFASYEPALRKELSDYLLEHARQESFALSTRPQVEFHTDERLDLGEFGIQAQLLATPEEEEEAPDSPATPPPSAGDFGHTMVYSPDREVRRLDPALDRRQALLVGEGRRNVLSGSHVVIGRSREADIVLADPNVSRRHAELRRDESGLACDGPRLDQRHQGQRPAREPGRAESRRSDHHWRDGPDLRARLAMDEPLAVALKFGFLAVLYLFLLWVVRSAMRDLARYEGTPAAAEPVDLPGPRRARAQHARPALGGEPAPTRGGCDGARAGHDIRRRRGRDLRPLGQRGHPRGRRLRLIRPRAHLSARASSCTWRTWAPRTAPT